MTRTALILTAALAASAAASGPCTPIPTQTIAPDHLHDFAHAGRAVSLASGAMSIGVYNDNRLGVGSGSMLVSRLESGVWEPEAELFPSRPSIGGWFGYSVDSDQDQVIAGAPFSIIDGRAAGSAFIFRYEPELGWTEEAELLDPLGEADDRFGHAVGIEGETAVVGVARADRHGTTNAGAAMIFRLQDGAWAHAQTLRPPAPAGAEAGWSLSLSGSTLVLGAPFADTDATNAGMAFVYEHNGSGWVLSATLEAPQPAPQSLFGWSVAASDDLILIGAPDTPHAGAAARGSVYTFVRNSEGWSLSDTIAPEPQASSDRFGTSVALDAGRAIIGDAGSRRAWLTIRENGSWSGIALMVPAQSPPLFYGVSAAIDANHAVVGSDRLAGSAYTFTLECGCPADFNGDGEVNFFDIAAYIVAFNNQDPAADLAEPFGVFNFFDVAAYIALYNQGCP